eukprot:654218-Amphidinium_carterae.1
MAHARQNRVLQLRYPVHVQLAPGQILTDLQGESAKPRHVTTLLEACVPGQQQSEINAISILFGKLILRCAWPGSRALPKGTDGTV